ncbi:MAG: hypothetical protein ACRC41_15325 [Sarcina sp.]
MNKEKILHRVLLCDQNNSQASYPGGVEPLHLDAPKNTDNEIKKKNLERLHEINRVHEQQISFKVEYTFILLRFTSYVMEKPTVRDKWAKR